MSDRSPMDRFGLGFLGLLAGGVLLWKLAGWWSLPPAVEFDNLKYIQLLSTAVSSRKLEMVEKVETAVRGRFQAGEMSPAELSHFEEIIALARQQSWQEADHQAYDFAAAQLNRRRSKPPPHDDEHQHSH